MNLLNKVRSAIKRKMPATFNAAEYEAERIIEYIEKNGNNISALCSNVEKVEQQLQMLEQLFVSSQKSIMETQIGLSNMKEEIEQSVSRQAYNLAEHLDIELSKTVEEQEMRIKDIQRKLSSIQEGSNKQNDKLMAVLESQRIASQKSINELKEAAMRADLNRVASCKSDDEYDECLIPLNQYFNNRGMAISMHLTSVAEKPAPVIYETADMIRTSALSLIADEINSRELDGEVAELGVARGKFARVINTVFPDRTLHLFDTFDDFPQVDIAVEQENQYSDARRGSYENIDLTALLKQMPYPEKCVVHKGYFPDTVQGFEERFIFVNIDCDLYKPIADGLAYFYPRTVKGGCIFVHDYRSKYFTGVKAALKEFAEKNEISYCVLPDNTGTAVIMK